MGQTSPKLFLYPPVLCCPFYSKTAFLELKVINSYGSTSL